MRLRFILAFLLCGVISLSAQTFRGGIQGTVTDQTGAALSGAQVKVTQVQTGLARTALTDAAGNYFVPELPLGEYTVAVSNPGFATYTVRGVPVAVAIMQHVDAQLKPGTVEQQVEVTGELPLVETTSNTLGGRIEAPQIESLPVSGRDFIKLLTFVPGSTADPSAVSDSPGSFGQFSINGNRGRSNNFLLDGTDMNDGYRNDSAINEAGVFGTPATLLPLDAIAEAAILTNTEAEYGRNSGATVNIVTKSGTNQWHGSVFEFFRNNWLDARNFFNTRDQPQDEFRNNQFGGSLGGPIIKDKTFFFLAYEGQREVIGIPEISTLPTQEMINNFVAGGGTINPVVANLLKTNPWGQALPATGDTPGGPNTLQQQNKSTNFLHSLIFKVDQHIGKDVLTGRYFFGDSEQSFPLAIVGGSGVPGFNTVTPTTVQVLSLSYTHVFSPKLLMEARAGWNQFDEDFFPQDRLLDPASIGLNTGVTSQDFGLPLIAVSGLSPIGANTSVPRGRVDRNYQFFTNVSYSAGKQNWKFGGEVRRTTVQQFFDSGYRGKISFGSFEDFLAGVPGGSARQATGNSDRHTAQNNVGFYAQNNWRATRNLTVNLGLRWDYFGVIGEELGQFSNFDAAAGVPKQVGQLYPKDYNNFGPRLSLAWNVGGKGTVVRAGWGVYYDAFSQDFFIGQLPFNTFNPGPAYNAVGPNPVTFNFGPANLTPVACGPGTISIPGSTLCAPPVFDPAGFCDATSCDVFTVDRRIRTPYVQNFNLNIEQQLGGHSALTVGYVGSQGRKLFRYRDINQPDPEAGTPSPFPSIFYINQFESSASSSYNALQTTYRIRGWHGVTSVVNFTWAHSIDNASDGQDFVAQATQPDNSLRPDRERGNSNFDTRRRFNWNFTYEFPNAQHMNWLLSGWSLDGVLTLMDGQPYNLTYQFENDFNGSGEFFGRPDFVPGVNPFAGTGGLKLLNLAAFKVPCTWDPVAGDCAGGKHFGNVGRNAFRGPSFKNFDFSIVKNSKLSERVRMQIRADIFNIFNHPNFTNPSLPSFAVDFLGNNPDLVPAGSLGTGVGFLTPTATPDVAIGNPFLGGGGPRNIQLAVRFAF